jgi:hypothetical protein
VITHELDGRIEHYLQCLEAGIRFGAAYPERYHKLIYERLTADPVEMLSQLMSAVGESLESGQLTFNHPHDLGIEDREGRPRFDVPWSPAEAEAFAAFNTADEPATALTASDRGLRALARLSMHSIGHVRGYYWHWFGGPELFSMRASDVLAIVWLPHLTESFPRLCERLGLGPWVGLPTEDVDAHRNPPQCQPTPE